MFGSIGGPELVLIFVVALLIFGPRKLPELGRMVGKGLGEFRRAANDLRVSLETEVAREPPGRAAGGGSAVTALATAPGATPRQSGGPTDEGMTGSRTDHEIDPVDPQDSRTAPAGAEHPAPVAAPDARDQDRTH